MSYRDDIVLGAIAGTHPNSKGWVRTACPMCEGRIGSPDKKRSFGLNVVSTWYSCYRCGISGKLQSPIDDFANIEVAEDEPAGIDGPPEGFLFLSEEPAASARVFAPAWDYLLAPTCEGGRGLTEAQIEAAQIGVVPSGLFYGRVIIPVFDVEGRWAWYVGRAWKKKAAKPYLYPMGGRRGLLYNHGALFEQTDEPLLLVEGCFDAIPFWPRAAAFLGKPTDVHMGALEAVRRPVVFVLDGDAWEEAWALTMRLKLAGVHAGFIKLPPRVDPDEVVDRVLALVAPALREGQATL